MSDFKEKLGNLASDFEGDLLACFNRPFDAPDNIVSAMKYSLFAGGKRIRPVMMMETCREFGGDVKDVKPLACAIEMIHTYSLIHDDLPAMDDDDLRRGKPTNHMVYGEDVAILAGDALLNYATEVALEGIRDLPADKRDQGIRAMFVLMESAGVNGMIGGQTGDLLCENDAEINEEKLKYVHLHKTAALLSAAALCGAIMAGASDNTIRFLSVYGLNMGMAFQIADDILDIVGDTDEMGKPVGSDAKNHKSTFVSLYGMASAQEKLREYRKRAMNALGKIQEDTTFLEELTDFICNQVL